MSDTPVKLYRETILGDCSVIQEVKPVSVAEASFDRNLAEDQMDQHLSLPEYVEPVYKACSEGLTSDQQSKVRDCLAFFSDLFARTKTNRGKTHLVQHKINTGNYRPIKQRHRKLPLAKRRVEGEEINKMLEVGVIESSCSPWASPVVLLSQMGQ